MNRCTQRRQRNAQRKPNHHHQNHRTNSDRTKPPSSSQHKNQTKETHRRTAWNSPFLRQDKHLSGSHPVFLSSKDFVFGIKTCLLASVECVNRVRYGHVRDLMQRSHTGKSSSPASVVDQRSPKISVISQSLNHFSIVCEPLLPAGRASLTSLWQITTCIVPTVRASVPLCEFLTMG